MKKSILFVSLAASLVLFAACSNGSGGSGSSDFPAGYNTSMEDVLEASKYFAEKSIKANIPSRTALNPTAEDKWEGRIKYQNSIWNVPSYFYGLEVGDELVVNGEDLGTLQDIAHKTDENGNFRKGAFVYNDYTYYIFDKGDYVENENYIVISSQEDINHLVVDQKDKTNTADFSNFKFWIWDRDLKNECYRRGNLGYAYTLRNVEMLDGSYANITVAGYNYFHFGFRVWIKESDGKASKAEYPQTTPYTFTSSYQVKSFSTDESGDFIYEIVNKTGATLKVRNYISDYNVYDFDNSIAAYYGNDFVTVANNETKSFKYKLSTLKGLLPFKTDNAGIGCIFQLEGDTNTPAGWENGFDVSGQKHTVIVTKEGNYLEGENQWSRF